MLEYLIQLPCEVMGERMMGFLDLNDIMQFEKAAASQKSQSLLRAVFPYCPPIIVVKPPENLYNLIYTSHNWFKKRQCRVQLVRISVELFSEVDFDHSILEGNIELYLKANATPGDILRFVNPECSRKITQLQIEGDQDPVVMGVLFSQLCNVRNLYIQSSNLSQWIENVNKIGPSINELAVFDSIREMNTINTITKYCPYLEKLSWNYSSYVSDSSNILQCIAINCPHLRILSVDPFYYITDEQCNADLSAFAEKCLQLEELSLYFQQLAEQSVIALAQHCSRLKKLKIVGCSISITNLITLLELVRLDYCQITIALMIALSERGLPLEELDIPMIPIFSAESAAQCAHALTRIRKLNTGKHWNSIDNFYYAIQYMTGLREMDLNSSEDHLLLQEGQFSNLESLYINPNSNITSQQLLELLRGSPLLHTLYIEKPTCISNAILVELAHSCPHLQRVTLHSSEVTEEGVLALAAHCRQLRVIDIPMITVKRVTVNQLLHHCRHLAELCVRDNRFVTQPGQPYIRYYESEIRELRESVGDISDTEVITDRCIHTCLIL